jgi:hypothetical protein
MTTNQGDGEQRLDTFNREDRKELIKHGFQLDSLVLSVAQITSNVNIHEEKIRTLEDTKLVAASQIKIVALIGALVASAINILIKVLWH